MGMFRSLRELFSPAVVYAYDGGDYGVQVENMDAAALYRTQPNLRAVVSFLADNAAQIPIKIHERRGDDDRPRVLDSPAALLMRQPNPDMSPFEFKRWLYSDLLIYERSLWLLLESADTESGWEMRPVPAAWIIGYKWANPYSPSSVEVCPPRGSCVEVPRERFVLFHGYSPTDPMRQYSRISALKETLQEQIESNRFRRQMWHRGGRFNAFITRPKDVQEWTDAAADRFKETFKASWAGDEAGEGGGMPILEDGMEIKTVQFNSRDAQWADSVKLSREDAAGVYHVNPALIWPGSGQTYASARDNARALYNDALAPLLMQVTDRITMDVLPRIGEPAGNYAAYDITIKTEGTLEEKIKAYQTACGGPFLSRDEVRGLMDYPAIGADELIVPMNVTEGGLASNHDTDPTVERYNALSRRLDQVCELLMLKDGAPSAPEAPAAEDAPADTAVRKARGDPADGDADALADVYRRFFERQARSVVPKIEAGAEWWDAGRWDRELADDLYPAAIAQADAAGDRAVADLWPGDATRSYGKRQTAMYIRRMCEWRARMVNAATYSDLCDALDADDGGGKGPGVLSKGLKSTIRGVFDHASRNRAATAAAAFAAGIAGFAVMEACRQNKGGGERVYKTWRTTSGNPRSSHRALNGETVPYGRPFSNGMQWPGDVDNGNASEVANCKCILDVEIRDNADSYDRATVRSVARELGLSDGYDPASVYAAYGMCSATIGQAGEWDALSAAQRTAVIDELRERDTEWVTYGKIPEPTYDSHRALNDLRPHEKASRDTIAQNGFAQHIIERSNVQAQKAADCLLGTSGRKADWKSPKGAGFNAIDQLMRDAGKKAEIAIVDLQEGRSVMSLDDAIGHWRACGARRGIREAIFIDYDRTVHRRKL